MVMEESSISELGESVKDHVGEWKQTASDAVGALNDRASKTLNQAGRAVDQTLTRAKYRTQGAIQNARFHVRRTTDEKPLQVIAGVAAAAFVAGVLLRIWRSSSHA